MASVHKQYYLHHFAVGFQSAFYEVLETDGELQVCVEVLEGLIERSLNDSILLRVNMDGGNATRE